jgi:SAM-dependent methyltransferase
MTHSRLPRWLALLGVAALFACASTKTDDAPSDTVAKAPTPAEGPATDTSDVRDDERAPEPRPDRGPDVRWVPTPQDAVDKMVEMAQLKKTDKVFDLGCGDGRIVVTAARKHGVRAIGVDIDPERVADSKENVRNNNVEDLVTILHADIFETDISDADVVFLYLLPELNVKLMPQLAQLKPGARIISYEFDMRGAKPAKVYRADDEDGYPYQIYKWVVPWESE